jgi:tRNA dimethylallyltransferase
MTDQPPNGVGNMPFSPVVALLGPTAVGKSRHALELCREFDGVILSADSRQIYRYMDICTAKPSMADRASVPHYMVDVIEPSESYSAQRFASEAERVMQAMAKRRTPVFVVGGTGFYVSVLLDRRSVPSVAPDPELRARLRAEAAEVGSQAMHARLQAMDPTSATRIHPNNVPRIVRALEIVNLTGRPVPVEPRRAPVPALYLGLQLERSVLHRTADLRIAEQMRSGLVEEVEMLLSMGYAPTLPALDGFGYRQMIQYVKGQTSREEAIEQYKIATHQYIRRQLTWFRKDDRISWFPVDSTTAQTLRERVQRFLATASAPVSKGSDEPQAET